MLTRVLDPEGTHLHGRATEFNLAHHDTWAGIVKAGHIGIAGEAGVTVVIPSNLQLATLIATSEAAGLQRVRSRPIGFDLPQTSSTVLTYTHGLIWSGPEQWLLIARQRAGFSDLLGLLSGEAAVSDQSQARAALLRLGDAGS